MYSVVWYHEEIHKVKRSRSEFFHQYSIETFRDGLKSVNELRALQNAFFSVWWTLCPYF